MSGEPRYYARSASDKTEDWPFWFVADRNGINKTGEAARIAGIPWRFGAVMTDRESALEIAAKANEAA